MVTISFLQNGPSRPFICAREFLRNPDGDVTLTSQRGQAEGDLQLSPHVRLAREGPGDGGGSGEAEKCAD